MSGGGDLVMLVPTSICWGAFLIVGGLGGGGSFIGGSKPGGGAGSPAGTGFAGGGIGPGYDLIGGGPCGCSTPKLPIVNGGGASLPASVVVCFGGGPAAANVLCKPELDEAEPVPWLPVAGVGCTGATGAGIWFWPRWSACSILKTLAIRTSFAFDSELQTQSAT